MYSEKRVAYLNGYKMKENVDKHINSPILLTKSCRKNSYYINIVNVRVDDTYIIMLHEYIMIILTCVRYDQVVQLLVMAMYS